jgi:hypothetical protein
VDKLNIANEMKCFDQKDRDFYDSLTDEERKKFSNYLMIRWGSSVNGSEDLQEYYLISTNERLNKHFFALAKHPKLQWLCATSVSPGLGSVRHNWISPKKKELGSGTIAKKLAELFPNLKDDEIELMAKINTKKDLDNYLKNLGKEVKK